LLARKRPDISWKDLACGMANAIAPESISRQPAEIPNQWMPNSESLVCLSVRSGLHLLLQALNLPRGSEVIVTSITIPDILTIIEHHGLIPIPVSIEPNYLEPLSTEIENAVTSKTRAILVAHLFGSRIEMQPIINISNRIGSLVIEDCAQAFVGYEYAGHEETDAVLFSFGPIKTATALGGAVLRIRNDSLRKKMRLVQSTYPIQGRLHYALRLLKYTFLKAASTSLIYGIFVRLLRLLGVDHDSYVSRMGHSFDRQHFFSAICRKPCKALKWLLLRRINRFDHEDLIRLHRRRRIGRRLSRCLINSSLSFPGSMNCTHTFWIVAVRVKQSSRLVHVLRNAGFDATTKSSLCDAITRTDKKAPQEKQWRSWLSETIFLPADPDMSAHSLRRMCRVLRSSLSHST